MFFPIPFMNIKVNGNPAFVIRNLIKNFFEKITQSPDFYNIKYYTKGRTRNRDQGDL